MIRRKIWATATFCLAVAGAANAQDKATKATLGKPLGSPSVVRGVAPNAGYPVYVPRNYVAPTAPGYATPAPALAPNQVINDTPIGDQFAVEADTPGMPPGAVTPMPMPMPMTPGGPATIGPAPTVIDSGMPMGTISGAPVVGTPMPINGGPIINGPGSAPFLDGMMYGDMSMPSLWISGEYLGWKMKGVEAPPLVTTAASGSPGTLGDINTFVTYGGQDLLRDWQSGFRVRAGMWFPDGQAGIDLGFFSIVNANEQFLYGSAGNQGLFRPFFNTAIRAEDAQLVAFSDPIAGPLLAGRVGTIADANLWGFEANYRTGWGMGLGGRLDALIGYRYVRLQDRLSIQTNSVTLVPLGAAPPGTSILTDDRFEALNQFHGGQVGLVGEWQIGQMTFGLRGTIGLGVTSQSVDIRGLTNSLTPAGTSTTAIGGLLALPTNIGDHDRTRFSCLPEVGVTLGYQVSNNCRIFGGYNVLYWNNVVRAGEQVNRNVNATFIPDPTTGLSAPAGAPAPTFHFRDDKFYTHGYTFGLELRW